MRVLLVGLAITLLSSSCGELFAAGELTFGAIALTPQSRVVPGGVLVLRASVGNAGDELAEGRIVVSIDELPKLQSARRVVLEAGQSESLDLFILIPETAREFKSIHLTATMVARYGQREVILERKGRPLSHSMKLQVSPGRTMGMALPADPPELPAWFWPQAAPSVAYEFTVATKLEAGLNRVTETYADRPLPLNQTNWDALDVFVIADPRVLDDGAAVESMRRYLASGGRLWIMLDLVPCRRIRPLLGPEQSCEEVERVELNDFVIESNLLANLHAEADRRVVSTIDIPMSRVVQEGGRVRYSVEGWPAAIEMDIGYGQLVLTTIDSRAWIEPRIKQSSQEPMFQSTYQPRVWATFFAADLNKPRASPPLSEQVDYPLRHIGNPIVPRSWVAIALLGFCAILIFLGLLLTYLGRPASLGLVAPLAALLVSISLMSAANWIRRDIPESLSRLQIVDVASDGSFASIREQAAVYLSTSASMALESQQDGSARTSEAITSGLRRFNQLGFQHWNLSNAAWPPGSWRYQTEVTLPTQGLIARGTLTRDGLHVQLPAGLPSKLEDPILSFVTGAPMLCNQTGSSLHANNHVTVAGDRWIAGTLISDEQQRRIEIYQKFFQPDKRLHRPTRRLYGWTTPWDEAHWNRELKQFGSALVALPIALERPAIGAEVSIPYGLIALRKSLAATSSTSVFDDRTRTWGTDISAGVLAEVCFLLPPEVLPLQVATIDLELDIKAPQREVTITAATQAGPIELAKLDGPTIPWTVTITDPSTLESFADGTLEVIVTVSDNNRLASQGLSANAVFWQINHFHASVRGTVAAKSSLSASRP